MIRVGIIAMVLGIWVGFVIDAAMRVTDMTPPHGMDDVLEDFE